MPENNVESAWTISKLSSSLSWLEEFPKIENCLFSFLRRVLTFPLYRHFDLGMECIKDVSKALKLGKIFLLKCFIDMKDIFEHDQEKYLLNNLFIDDYCIWIQKTSFSIFF
jgi:protein SHQ1